MSALHDRPAAGLQAAALAALKALPSMLREQAEQTRGRLGDRLGEGAHLNGRAHGCEDAAAQLDAALAACGFGECREIATTEEP